MAYLLTRENELLGPRVPKVIARLYFAYHALVGTIEPRYIDYTDRKLLALDNHWQTMRTVR